MTSRTSCINNTCPDRDICHRAELEPSPKGNVAAFHYSFTKTGELECDFFWPINEIEGNKNGNTRKDS